MSEKTPETMDGWRKSSLCDNSSGNCVEVKRRDDRTVSVRRSSRPGFEITYSPDEWSAFIAGAKNGEFDV